MALHRCLRAFSSVPPARVLRVDRGGLFSPSPPAPTQASEAQASLQSALRSTSFAAAGQAVPAEALAAGEEDTPLAVLLRSSILGRGPISMAEFMALCLSHPQHGYYMQPGPVLGRSGDFVTSPELSQLFGEMVGVWCVAALEASVPGSSPFHLVEGGPGRGTLARDVLHVLARFPAHAQRLRAVHLVETSPTLRAVQASTLGCHASTHVLGGQQGQEGSLSSASISEGPWAGTPVHWFSSFSDLPPSGQGPDQPAALPAITLCHELFDALPVHQFTFTPGGWREILVDVQGQQLRNVLSPGATPASAALSAWLASDTGRRYQQLCSASSSASASGSASASWPSLGDVCETSPASQGLFNDLALRVRSSGGAALLVDYGPQAGGARALSIRGIQRHAFVDTLASPGRVDLSANVDFACFQAIGEAVPGVAVLGPVGQGRFLQQLGLGARLQRLCAGREEAVVQALVGQARRLAHPEEMGGIFKAMAIVPEASKAGLAPFF
jgi:NADH dehydrogenase [ubiquinone] 1 alpha subcomplex assembly factor 7